jgi:enoyl-CoA hydratase/carnithine racemase
MLEVEKKNNITSLRLNRPDRRNALGSAMMHTLGKALFDAEADETCHVIVITASPPAFSSGSDLKELGGMTVAEMCVHEAETAAVARAIGLGTKPVVVAVEGFALGGGCVLAISCDVVVTAANARWHLPEVQIGWLPPWGLQTLLARVGPVKARLLTWGHEAISGDEATRIGLADYVTAEGQAAARAYAIAEALAKLPPEAVASTKRFFQPYAAGAGESMDFEASRVFADNCKGPVAKATLKKFGEKK